MRAALFLLLASGLAHAADPAPGVIVGHYDSDKWGGDAPVLVADAGAPTDTLRFSTSEVKSYEVQAVARCEAVDGPVGSGCWVSEPDCIAMAKERTALRQALQEASLKPAPSAGVPLAFLVVVVSLGAGFAAGWALAK